MIVKPVLFIGFFWVCCGQGYLMKWRKKRLSFNFLLTYMCIYMHYTTHLTYISTDEPSVIIEYIFCCCLVRRINTNKVDQWQKEPEKAQHPNFISFGSCCFYFLLLCFLHLILLPAWKICMYKKQQKKVNNFEKFFFFYSLNNLSRISTAWQWFWLLFRIFF